MHSEKESYKYLVSGKTNFQKTTINGNLIVNAVPVWQGGTVTPPGRIIEIMSVFYYKDFVNFVFLKTKKGF